jgi:hypothetical protein
MGFLFLTGLRSACHATSEVLKEPVELGFLVEVFLHQSARVQAHLLVSRLIGP